MYSLYVRPTLGRCVRGNFSTIKNYHSLNSRPGSVVGIANGYELDGPGIESRWGGGARFPHLSRPALGPASCTMGTGSFRG